jgi:multimeric flavodoxin WrbA
MKSVVIVYHSGYGHTAKQANAVYEGAKSVDGINAKIVSVADIEAHWDDLDHADAIIFGAPTYMGSVSAEFKKFMESSSKAWYSQKWLNKLAAGFTNSGSLNGDKFNALVQLSVFAAQHGMTWVNLGILPSSGINSTPADLNYLGSYLGAMAQSQHEAQEAPHSGDLATAKHLGQRVAQIALKML